jgi:chemotaxis regulatin CheY-phosphate phosphatase CheZ|tara:strand:+ start:222 stop:479 length:258 start_codon:yes stop_codon:yes gene_type:complete
MTTEEPLNYVLQNGETLEYYWTLAGQENMGYNEYFDLKQEWLKLFNNERGLEQARELFSKINAYFTKEMNVLIDEIIYLKGEEKK